MTFPMTESVSVLQFRLIKLIEWNKILKIKKKTPHSSVKLDTFQVLTGHIWLVAAVLDSEWVEYI